MFGALNVSVLACVQASNVCARRVGVLVGVTTDLGPSGGYNTRLVVNKTAEMVDHVISGEIGEICG